MEGVPDLPEGSSSKKLNRAIAMTVVTLSVSMAMTKIKDDNIVQAMQAAQAAKIDTWNEYQASKIKLHISQQSPKPDAAAIAKYQQEAAVLKAKALAAQSDYDRAGYRDDQFDLADGFASIALGVSAIAALIESWGLLGIGWAAGLTGLLFTVAGFAGYAIHPDALVSFLS
jgi:hypothetical protein